MHRSGGRPSVREHYRNARLRQRLANWRDLHGVSRPGAGGALWGLLRPDAGAKVALWWRA